MSANLCEAVASMRPDGDQAHLQIRMTWSSSRPRLPKGVESVIGFSQTAFEIVRESGRKLREEVFVTRARLEGRIITRLPVPSADAFPNTTPVYQIMRRHFDALKDSVLAQFFLR